MSEPEMRDLEAAPVRLDSHFLMGSDGRIYEIPLQELDRFRVTPEREKELGHLPFSVATFTPHLQAADEVSDEVEGHHLVQDPLTGGWTAHSDWQYGAFLNPSDGSFCVAFHRHPYGDAQVEVAEGSEFA